jgi:hypothetical protein
MGGGEMTQTLYAHMNKIKFFFKWRIQRKHTRPGLVAHTCDPSYSGGRDWGDRGLRTIQSES